MKNRFISLIMCVLMILSCVPFTGVQIVGQPIVADAAEIVEADTSELQKIYDSIPAKSDWASTFDFISDIQKNRFETLYSDAERILKDPDFFTQATVDNVAQNLKNCYDELICYALSVKLSKTSLQMEVGESVKLKATVFPSNAEQTVKWTSSNSAVTVDRDGTVTVNKYTKSAVAITATSYDGKAKATCSVKVLNTIGSLKLSATSKTMYDKQSFTLGVTLVGKDSANAVTDPDKAVYYFDSTDRTVATVTDSGKVKTLKAGKTDITVKVVHAGKTLTAKCALTVKEMIRITSLTPITKPSDGKIKAVAGETTTFKLTVLPKNATIMDLTWKSSNEKVAKITDISVSGNTVIMKFSAVGPGSAKITYTSKDGSGKKGSFTAVVAPYVSSLSISQKVKVIAPDSKTEKLKVSISPKNAGNQTINWTSSNSKICTVDRNGVLTAKSRGVCTITASTRDGSNLSVSCKVRVAPVASKITVSPSSTSLDGTKTKQLTATVKTIEGTTYKDCVRWVSSNPSVVSVSSSGTLTAHKGGQAVITAITADGKEKTDACVVKVSLKVTGVSLTKSKEIAKGKTYTLKPAITPKYAENQKVSWSSSDKSVATVSSKGVVTAKKTGTAVITVKTSDGGYKATCTVKVVIATTGIKLSKTKLSVKAGNTQSLTATVSPSSATNKTVKWSTSNSKVATVSSKGVVTAVAGGTCTITATASGGQKATCSVSVSQDVSSVSLSEKECSVFMTDSFTLKASVLPATATYDSIKWTSSDKSVATVSSKGVVKGINEGTAVITAQAGSKQAQCTVTVIKNLSVTSVKLNYKTVTVGSGNSLTLTQTVSPSTASNKKVTWKSSDTSVATVSSSGVVTGKSLGTAKITVTTVDGGKTAICTVTVAEGVTGIRISSESLKLSKGKTKTLRATVFPTYAANTDVIWSSSDTSVATVSQSGVVTAKKDGTAVITVRTIDGGKEATCKVRVYNMVKGVSITKTSLTVEKGESKALGCNVKPSNATDARVTWTSSNKAVASVDSSGVVTGRMNGTVTITVKTKDGGYTAKCKVKVITYAESLTLDFKTVKLRAGRSKVLSASMTPLNVSNKTVSWKSSNTKVAKVDKNGKVTAVAGGSAVITATSGDGKVKNTCKINVSQKISKIKIKAKTTSVNENGAKIKLEAVITPSTATEKTIKWKTSDKSIATVSQSGVVTGKKLGKVKITAENSDGTIKATCFVNVTRKVTKVEIDKTVLKMTIGRKIALTAQIKPTSASNKKVKWSSNNVDVATVDSKGVVTAKGPGYCEITVKTVDGGKKDVCKVTVIAPVKGVSLNVSQKTLEAGKSYTLKATLNPKNASNDLVSWSSSNKKVAKVDKNGKVTAVGTGTATITVKTDDGGYKAQCKITVIIKAKSVKLSKTSAVLYMGTTQTLKATVSPSNSSNKKVTWSSSNTSVVTVSSSGKLTPKKVGTATITVKTADGGYTAKCKVSVEIAATKLTLSSTKSKLDVGKTLTLKATVSPSNITNKNITWTSSNKAVATVSSSGKITAVKAGKAVITAKTSNGIAKTCEITVGQPVSGVTLDKTAVDAFVGHEYELNAVVLPEDADNKAVTWASSDPTVVSVSQDGTVKALKEGTATITVKTADGGKTAVCVFNVMQKITAVYFTMEEIDLTDGEQFDLSDFLTVLPSGSSQYNIKWTSSDSEIADVSSNGTVTAKKQGSVVISAETSYEGLYAEITVNVTE